MFKKISFFCIFFILLLFTSCNNLIVGDSGENNFSFAVGNVGNNIRSTLEENNNVKNDTEIKVVCELLRGDIVSKKENKTVKLQDLYKTSFDLTNIPNGNNYFISLNFFYNDILIYKAFSDKIILDESNEKVNVELKLQQNNSAITYELNGGKFIEEQEKVTNYFINSNVLIPAPEKKNSNFDGWYLSSDFKPETKVTELGKNCFLGNVTLYAKWIEISKVVGVTISPASEKIDFGDLITLNTTTNGATIHYTLDGSIPSESSPVYVNGFAVDDNAIGENDKIVIKAIAMKDGMDNSDLLVKEYTLNTYSVTFHTAHGNLPSDANKTGLKKGDSIINPGVLSETGYTFGGWFGNSSCDGPEFNFSSNIQTSDLDIFAKWTINTYKVKFDSNNGSDEVVEQNFTYNEAQNLRSNTFENSNTLLSFIGWNTDKLATEKLYDDSQNVNNLTTDNNKVITLYAIWKDITPPGPVTNVVATSSDRQVVLTWENPTEDFSRVELLQDGVNLNIGNTAQTKTVTALVNGNVNNFTLNTYDLAGNKTEVTKKAFAIVPTYSLHESVMSIGANDYGKDSYSGGTYVIFGDYPQTVKASNVCISDNTVKVNAFDCYYGSDGNYYVKAVAQKHQYTGNFDDNTAIDNGTEYFFKIEPIKWRVLDTAYSDANGINQGRLLLAEKGIDASMYSPKIGYRNNIEAETVKDNVYKYSQIRAYLNGLDGSSYQIDNFKDKGFLQKAFSTTAQSKIKEIEVINDAESNRGPTDYGSDGILFLNTTDKIFLLGSKESANTAYGFNSDFAAKGPDSGRLRKTTDYSRAIGACSQYENYAYWWLRSIPWHSGMSNKAYQVIGVDGNYGMLGTGEISDVAGAVVPALVIN